MRLPRKFLRSVLLAAALLGVAATSFVTLSNDEQGVVERFGRPVRDLGPGLHVKLPWPFENVRRTPSGQSSLQMPIGFRLVDEAAGLAPPPALTRWLTGDSNIVELRANLLYRVVDARKWLYGASRLHATDPERPDGPWEAPEFALRRLGEAALTELLSRADVDDVLTGGAAGLANRSRTLVQERADRLGLGVEISTVQILRRDPLASVANAFRQVQDAQADAERSRQRNLASRGQILSDANIRAAGLRNEAASEAARLEQEAIGRAQRFIAISDEVGDVESSAGRRLRLEALRGLLSSGRVRVVQPGTPERPSVVFESGQD